MSAGGTIAIRAENIPYGAAMPAGIQQGNWIKVVITDQGSGIPEEFIHRIFEPYFTTKQDGSGLGLATTYAVIKKHGGEILAENEPGQGARFTLYIPANPDTAMTETAAMLPASQARRQILLMDDEAFIRTATSALLEKMGHRVSAVAHGQEAIDEYERVRQTGQPFDIVILDLTIPGGMGGRDALSRLREIDPAVRAIASSGYSEDAVMSDPIRHGFKSALAKPYNRDELVLALNKALLQDAGRPFPPSSY
jgi:CheY-like chemotaxis protein